LRQFSSVSSVTWLRYWVVMGAGSLRCDDERSSDAPSVAADA
jgi:hypothetical protein